MDVDGICPVQSDSLEHKPAPLQSLADLGTILIFNLKVSGILGGIWICLRPPEVLDRLRSLLVCPDFRLEVKNKFDFNGL